MKCKLIFLLALLVLIVNSTYGSDYKFVPSDSGYARI